MRKLLAGLFSCCFIFCTQAQEFSETYMTVTEPSAEAASIAKFGATPVSHYNGKATISIPLHTLTGKRLSLPISLSYDHSGIKVDDEASWVGLGWTLNAGGVVSRSIMGADDFSNGDLGWHNNPIGFIYSDAVTTTNVGDQSWISNTLPQYCRGVYDNQPDMFFYNFNGHSGKFVLKQKANPNDPVEVHLLSNDKMDISYDEVTKTWTFITINGTKYIFGTVEESQTWTGNGGSKSEIDPNLNYPDYVYDKKRITSWYLDKIISPQKEVIDFTYSTANYSQETYSFSEMRKLPLNYVDGLCPTGVEYQKTGSKTGTFLKYLTKIELYRDSPGQTQKREVRFNTSDRDDIAPYYDKYGDITYLKPQKLDDIEIYEGGQLLKTISFVTDYTGAAPAVYDPMKKRMILNSVEFLDAGSTKINDYKFEYNPLELPDKHSYSKDYWGYNNGADVGYWNGNATLIPTEYAFLKLDGKERQELRYLEGADREADETEAQAQILTKVIYPTGGHTEYEYELNDFVTKKALGELKEYEVTGNQTITFTLERQAIATIDADLIFDLAPRYDGDGGPSARQATMADYPAGVTYSSLLKFSGASDINPLYALAYNQYTCVIDGVTCNSGITKYEGQGGIYPHGVRKEVDEFVLSAGTYVLKANAGTNWIARMKVSYLELEDTENPTMVTEKGGGLRIKRVIDHDGISTQNDVIRTYEYTKLNDLGETVSSGRLMTLPEHHYTDQYATRYSVRTSAVNLDVITDCYQFTSSSYSTRTLANAAQGSSVGYDRVTEHTNGNGRTVMTFINESSRDIANGIPLPNAPNISFEYKNGKALTTEVYNEQGQILVETTNDYAYSVNYNGNYFFFRNTGTCEGASCLNGTGGQDGVSTFQYLQGQGSGGQSTCLQIVPRYFYAFYDLEHEFWYIDESTTTEYFYENGIQSPVTTKSFYVYNTDHKQLIQEKKEILKDGATTQYYVKNTQYALDPGITVPGFLLTQHIHNLPLHVEEKIDDTRTSAYEYVYSDANGGTVNMTEVKRYDFDKSSYETFRQFGTNQYGDLLKVEQLGDKQSYLYSDDGFYTIAIAQNAEGGEVAHTSFEPADGNGNWSTLTGTTMTEPLPPTGSNYFMVPASGGVIGRTGMDTNTEYELSFWARGSGTISITGGDNVSPTSDWQLYRVKISGVSSLSITTSVDTDFDEVNLYPKGTLLSTYAYKRGYGLISERGPDDIIMHYEYDDYGRLSAVKDQKGNVLKYYEYAYNQTVPTTQQN